MTEQNTNSFISDVQREYDRIDRQWMLLHYRTIIGTILLSMAVELSLGFFFFGMEKSIAISFELYVQKFILRPLLYNIVWLGITIAARHVRGISVRTRAYVFSIALVGVCFVLYSAHYIFFISLVFFAPVLLSAFYGEYTLTGTVGFISLLAKLVSDFFVFWDATRELPFESGYTLMRIVVSTLILIVFYAVSMIIISFQKKKNNAVIQIQQKRIQMHQELITDPLTGIHNRRALRNMLETIESPARDTCFFAMLDLDSFKHLNDTYGHAKGDECLQKFGGILKRHSGRDVASFRLGGDEFCVLFRNKTRNEVIEICEAIRHEYASENFGEGISGLTISVGISQYKGGMFPEDMMQSADKALYRAKKQKGVISF